MASTIPPEPPLSARGAKGTADLYFSKVVRARGHCERCGNTSGPFEAAHIIRRRYVGDPDGIGLRTNEDNAWCLCPPCHRTVDLDPVAFVNLVNDTLGDAKYSELLHIRNALHRPWRESDWVKERQRLLALLKASA